MAAGRCAVTGKHSQVWWGTANVAPYAAAMLPGDIPRQIPAQDAYPRGMRTLLVAGDDPESADVRELLDAHLALVRAVSPPEDVHALDVTGLVQETVSFFSVRLGGHLLGIGALKRLDDVHAELKSMHTAHTARGKGVGRAMLDHLLGTARARGYERVSLETGSMAAFAPARALYASAGFKVCEPFGEYHLSPHSTCMTLELGDRNLTAGS